MRSVGPLPPSGVPVTPPSKARGQRAGGTSVQFHAYILIVGMGLVSSLIGTSRALEEKPSTDFQWVKEEAYAKLQWEKTDGCNKAINSTEYNRKLVALGQLALRRSDGVAGCVTTRYLEPSYDQDCRLGICSDVHAGVDLRARTPLPVYPIERGKVVRKSLNIAQRHSTLIIENLAQTRKILYLHMSEISVAEGDDVSPMTSIGKSGSVGTREAHLHIEVWPNGSPWYCSREQGLTPAISGSACAGKMIKVENPTSRRLEDKTVCTLEEVKGFTIDPADIAMAQDKDAPLTSTRLSKDSGVAIDGVGPIRVGMTPVEAESALGGLLVRQTADERCAYLWPKNGPGGVSFMVTDGRISRIDIDSCQFKTLSGAHIGTTEADLGRLYSGMVTVTRHQYVDQGHDMTVKVRDTKYQDYRVVFETDGSRVTRFRAGRLPEVGFLERCL